MSNSRPTSRRCCYRLSLATCSVHCKSVTGSRSQLRLFVVNPTLNRDGKYDASFLCSANCGVGKWWGKHGDRQRVEGKASLERSMLDQNTGITLDQLNSLALVHNFQSVKHIKVCSKLQEGLTVLVRFDYTEVV